MHDRNDATSGRRRRPVAAFVAVVLAFALAFMAFEPNALRSAFANEGDAATADAAQPESGGVQATEPAEGEPTEGDADDGVDDGVAEQAPEAEGGASVEEEAPAEDPSAVTGDDKDGNDARAGPGDAADPSGESSEAEAEPEPEAQAERDPKARATFASCTVTFYSNVASENPSILARKLVTAEVGQKAQVVVSDVVAAAPTGAEVFDGWLYGGETHTDSIEVDPQDGNVRLYPAFSSGHWLRFVEGDSGSDAVYVPSQFIGATEQAPATLPTTTREGYAFAGWYTGDISNGVIAYGTQVTDGNGAVLDPESFRAMLGTADVVLYASWQAVETTYRVITWHQNPDGDGYSYQGYVTVGGDGSGEVISGEMTDVSQVPEVPGFTAQEIKQERIKGDGSTVVNAYYDRNTYKVVFHQGRTDESALFDELTIEDLYGADIHDDWPKPSESEGRYSASWYTLPDENSSVFVTGIGTMPLGGAHYYLKNDSGTDCNTKYMVQNVDGSDEFTEYVSQPFTTENSPWTTADDYMPIEGFMVNAASAADAEAIREIPAGDKAATYDPRFKQSAAVGAKYVEAPVETEEGDVPRHTLYFHYLRCQYDIVFEENGGQPVDDIEDIYFEAPLTGLEPGAYVVGETQYTAHDGEVYEFAGWYDNADLEGDPYTFDSKTMPASNIVLYADWQPARHLVQVDPAGGEFVNPAQSTYFWVDHGKRLDYIDAERNYVPDSDGAYVYDYETVSSDDDKFGNAEYVTANAGDTGQRYSWSEDAYSLFGWYRIDDAARAEVPFDFNAAITEDTSIVARWRAAGMYDIAYNPTMQVEGTTVTGDIDTMLDDGYADLSPTLIMNTPEDIVATDGLEYTFSGWQVVESFEAGADVLDDALYVEGDGFVVDSELATDNTIHLQALYEPVPADPADPSDPADPADPVDPVTPSADGAAGGGDAGSQQASGMRAWLPKTGDELQALAIGIGGFALAALGVALIARALRRNDMNED